MEHAKVNGVELAYEVVGSGDPMLLIHGAHPFGGAIALELAAQHPTRVAALLLLEPPFLTTPASAAFTSAMAPLVERYEAGDAEGAVHGFLALVGDRNWCVTIDQTVPAGSRRP
jgi:pimeloyl-ACP methyl ester carboxylesterase